MPKTAPQDHRSNAEGFRDNRHGGLEAKQPLELQGYTAVPEIDSSTRLEEVDGRGVDGPQMSAGRVQRASPVELA